jgi:NADH dehydrogenase/NADH:ubiquinone oxidoreductase subunit G
MPIMEKTKLVDPLWARPIDQKEKFKIYQGHHGNQGAKEANIIIPSTTYVEKKGTYISIEGIIQETQPVIEKEKGIYNDKIIIEKI